MNKYRSLLFDLDGTLTYSHPGIYAIVSATRWKRAGRGAADGAAAPTPASGPPLVLFVFRHIFGMSGGGDGSGPSSNIGRRYADKGTFRKFEPVPGAARDCLRR